MSTYRQLFLEHLAQTSTNPLLLEFVKAKGIYLYDRNNKPYVDLISGIGVSNVGHLHPKVTEAIKDQADKHLHLMVYGEYIQAPQVQLAKALSDSLPKNLNCTYFVNSGSEAVEGALKLAKRYTQRIEVITFNNAYHGSTHGALSVTGNESLKNAYRPLLPGIRFLNYNSIDDLEHISEKTACVIIETIQGEAGAIVPTKDFMQKLRNRCNDKGVLLILDEIQTGYGRTGRLFAFEHYMITPDILVIAKGMGGGMPIGGFISSKEIMSVLIENPPLGHITTFGGHPLSCASGLAVLQIIKEENLVEKVDKKEKLFRKLLNHHPIRGKGLLLAIEFETSEIAKSVIDQCIRNGVITDWFLFAENCMRIAPPLTITNEEIENACSLINKSIQDVLGS